SQAKAHLDARGNKGNVQMFVAAAAPASVHLEVLDFFGKPSGILISDGTRSVMLAPAENVSRVLPVSLPPEELVAMLLGRAPRLPDPAPTLLADPAENVFRVTLRAAGRTQELWVDPTHKRVVRSQVDGPGAYTLTFADFVDVRGAPFPRAITFAGAGRVAFEYTDLRLGEQPDAALFTPEAPPGVPVEQISSLP